MIQLLKFFLGIILVQLVTAILIYFSPTPLSGVGLFQLLLPLFFISLMVAFWFSSLAQHLKKDALNDLQNSFAKEREDLRVNAERAKTKVIKQAQKEIAKEAKVTHAKANFKVGAAFAGVMGVGALFVFAQMVTVGLLTLTATFGAMGGYYYRGKRLENQDLRVIEVKPKKLLKK